MRYRLSELVIFLAFGAAVAYVGWKTFGPAGLLHEQVGGSVETMFAAEPREKNFYVRRTFYFPQRPRTAWIQVIGWDEIELYVNGRTIDIKKSDLMPATIVVDLASRLRKGKNVIAAVCRQTSLHHLPELSIKGTYKIGSEVYRFGGDTSWHYENTFDRRNDYWFAIDYDDRDWSPVRRGSSVMVSSFRGSARALTEPSRGQWIRPDELTAASATIQRVFEVPEPIEYAWLRLQSNASYRLAVNGVMIDREEERLGTTLISQREIQWIYDLSPLVQRDRNALTLKLDTSEAPVQLRADLEVMGQSGQLYHFASDENWQWRTDSGDAWLTSNAPIAPWQACHAEAGDGGMPLSHRVRRFVVRRPPLSYRVGLWAQKAGLTLLLASAAWLLCSLLDKQLVPPRMLRSGVAPRGVSPAVLALVPPTVLLISGIIVAFDPRIPSRWIYQPAFVAIAAALLAVQWLVLLPLARHRNGVPAPAMHRRAGQPTHGIVWLLLLIILSGGVYFRIRDIATRPLSPDEVTMYRAAMGFWEYGFPGFEIHEDIPIVYAATSELVQFGGVLGSLLFEDERLVLRAVPTCWGILTILVIFFVGKGMFDPWAGVFAAAIYAFSPYCINMANLGRYYSQLQIFTLLTVYFFYRTIAPRGPLNRRALALTVITFVVMFLSWEGSAILALPMICAALVLRHKRVRSVINEPAVWMGMLIIASVIIVQSAHRTLVQTQRPMYGSGASEAGMTRMWELPGFDPWYFVWTATWNRDLLLPTVGLVLAAFLAIRHASRKPTRFLFIILLGTALAQALLLPVTTRRYGFHLVPIWVLLVAAVLAVLVRELSRVRMAPGQSHLAIYARAVAALAVVAFVSLANGMTVDLAEMKNWRGTGEGFFAIKFPGQRSTALFVRERLKPDDVVIVNAPHVIDHYLGRPSDYWLQTQLHLQATLDDKRSVPLHKYKGTPMIANADQLRNILERHDRVWFITEPNFNVKTNTSETMQMVRANMDVVFEDYDSIVMFRGPSHRPVSLQRRNEKTLRGSDAPHLR